MKKYFLMLVCMCLFQFSEDVFAFQYSGSMTKGGYAYTDYFIVRSVSAGTYTGVFYNSACYDANHVMNATHQFNPSCSTSGYVWYGLNCNVSMTSCGYSARFTVGNGYINSVFSDSGGGNYVLTSGVYNDWSTSRDVYSSGGSHSLILADTNTFTLIITPNPQLGGEVISSPEGINCPSGSCQSTFSGNVTLTATATEGWVFSHWVDGTNNYSDNPKTVSMSDTKTMKAVFHLLSFPLAGFTPYTVPVVSVFDHSATGEYGNDTDHHVETFTGEVSSNQNPYSGTTCYPKADNSAFGSGFNYTGYEQAGIYYLCYDGHPGFDYSASYGTDVYAAADGIAHLPSSFPGVNNAQGYATVEIDHGNGYKTYYLHLSSLNVTENQQVYRGQTVIGHVGHTVPQDSASVGNHLHFEVQLNGVPVDPYGWAGSGSDPYTQATNNTLWR